MRKLPPLNALKAFEACARHKSFTAAADELLVTQSAVSRQIKILEDWLGSKLVHRSTLKLKLTPQGRKLAPLVEYMLDEIAAITTSIKDNFSEVSIRVPPTFAVRWLLPRIDEFSRQFPEISVRVVATDTKILAKEPCDLGIVRVGSQTIPELVEPLAIEALIHEHLVPVIAPRLVLQMGAFVSSKDLLRCTLIHPCSKIDYWAAWLLANNVKGRPHREQIYEYTDVAIQATIRGQGITLANPNLIEYEITSGQLVPAFDTATPVTSTYCLFTPHSRPANTNLLCFKDWLLLNIRQDWQDALPVQPIMSHGSDFPAFTASQ